MATTATRTANNTIRKVNTNYGNSTILILIIINSVTGFVVVLLCIILCIILCRKKTLVPTSHEMSDLNRNTEEDPQFPEYSYPEDIRNHHILNHRVGTPVQPTTFGHSPRISSRESAGTDDAIPPSEQQYIEINEANTHDYTELDDSQLKDRVYQKLLT